MERGWGIRSGTEINQIKIEARNEKECDSDLSDVYELMAGAGTGTPGFILATDAKIEASALFGALIGVTGALADPAAAAGLAVSETGGGTFSFAFAGFAVRLFGVLPTATAAATGFDLAAGLVAAAATGAGAAVLPALLLRARAEPPRGDAGAERFPLSPDTVTAAGGGIRSDGVLNPELPEPVLISGGTTTVSGTESEPPISDTPGTAEPASSDV